MYTTICHELRHARKESLGTLVDQPFSLGRTSFLFCTVPVALARAVQLRTDGFSCCCYIINVHNHPSWATSRKEGIAWYFGRPMPSLWVSPLAFCLHDKINPKWSLGYDFWENSRRLSGAVRPRNSFFFLIVGEEWLFTKGVHHIQ